MLQEAWAGPSNRRVLQKPHRVLTLQEHGLVKEAHLDSDGFRMADVFSDTSVHSFPVHRLQEAAALFT